MRLTVSDLLLDGEPLSPAEVLAGEDRLDNSVSWVVSLRPYAPAFPKMRGEELALVATESLARLDLPPTLAEVLQQLARLRASAVAVKGEVDNEAISAARELNLPLLLLPPDSPIHDIEQAVMRECAMRQALAEVRPQTDSGWLAAFLDGTEDEVPASFVQTGEAPAHYAVAYVPDLPAKGSSDRGPGQSRAGIEIADLQLTAARLSGGIAVLVPVERMGQFVGRLTKKRITCGIGTPRPPLQARLSFEEAKLAATASKILRDELPTLYTSLGADTLLLRLHRDAPDVLATFVSNTLGPLLRHDERSSVPWRATLEAFLSHGGRLRETAAALYVHRNTLAYRLRRIEELLGRDLNSSDDRLAIELALRALPLVR